MVASSWGKRERLSIFMIDSAIASTLQDAWLLWSRWSTSEIFVTGIIRESNAWVMRS
jgi:hypothetical protein